MPYQPPHRAGGGDPPPGDRGSGGSGADRFDDRRSGGGGGQRFDDRGRGGYDDRSGRGGGYDDNRGGGGGGYDDRSRGLVSGGGGGKYPPAIFADWKPSARVQALTKDQVRVTFIRESFPRRVRVTRTRFKTRDAVLNQAHRSFTETRRERPPTHAKPNVSSTAVFPTPWERVIAFDLTSVRGNPRTETFRCDLFFQVAR